MLGHQDTRLGHAQQLLLAVGMNGQLADHLTTQNTNDDLSELAEELGLLEDAKAQARLFRNGDNEVTMSYDRQPLNQVGRDRHGLAIVARCGSA